MTQTVLNRAEPVAGQQNGSDFAQLAKRVNAAGLLRRRPGYYIAKISFTILAFAVGWVAFALVGASWWTLAVAVFLAVASTQVAFLGHDFGHRQVFRTRGPSEIAGLLVGNLSIGMSLGWWISKHTRHHANPNHEDEDPDVGAGALVWTSEQAAARKSRLGRWLARKQAFLFFPMLLLEGLNLKADSVKAIRNEPMRNKPWEIALMVTHTVLYLSTVFVVLPVGMGFAFIAVHQALFGLYMGCSFAPNHKGMPMPGPGEEWDFLRKQVLTSRNVKGGPIVDFVLGGLNYQIEHHLFPSMPRANLRKVQPIVRQFCFERGVTYVQTGLIDSYRQGLQHLHEVGQAAA